MEVSSAIRNSYCRFERRYEVRRFGCDMALVGERVVGVFGIDKGQEMDHEIAKAKVLNGIRQ